MSCVKWHTTVNAKYLTGAANKPKRSSRQNSRPAENASVASFPVPNEARLSTVKTESGDPDLLKNLDESSNMANEVASIAPNNTAEKLEMPLETTESKSGNDEKQKDPKEEKPSSPISSNIDSLIEKQKKTEEENKRKKAAILKAIEDR